jgi:hypothetical protein
MGDHNTLASGTVAHKHSAPSADGGTLSTEETLLEGNNLYSRIIVGA